MTVSIPPKHVPGKIEWASAAPGDPNDNFVVRDAAYLDGDKEFVQCAKRSIGDATARKSKGAGVHPRLQHAFCRGPLWFRPGRSRLESARRPGAVHVGVARQIGGLHLRHQQRDSRARRVWSIRFVLSWRATPNRSISSHTPWAIGSRSRPCGRSRYPAISNTRTKLDTSSSPRRTSTSTCSSRDAPFWKTKEAVLYRPFAGR